MTLEKEQKYSVGVILQARMGSSRLPGKVMMPFGHTTVLGWIIERLKILPWPLIVATTIESKDNEIFDYCMAAGVKCYRGSEYDVLDRYFQCALVEGFEHVIRLTGDNPFSDIEELCRLVTFHLDGAYNYCHNIGLLPVGVGGEIFSISSLEKSWIEGQEPHHREHVNEYILENPRVFKIGSVDVPKLKQATIALTIDTLADYQRIRDYLELFDDFPITTEDLLSRCLSSV